MAENKSQHECRTNAIMLQITENVPWYNFFISCSVERNYQKLTNQLNNKNIKFLWNHATWSLLNLYMNKNRCTNKLRGMQNVRSDQRFLWQVKHNQIVWKSTPPLLHYKFSKPLIGWEYIAYFSGTSCWGIVPAAKC